MENIDAKAIIERIRQLRDQYAGRRGKSKFAEALNISPSTYSYYESDRIPPIEILLKICQVTGADLEWLLTGSANEIKNPFGQNTSLLRKLDALLTENPEMTSPILAFIQLLCEKKGFKNSFLREIAVQPGKPPAKPNRPGWIPVLGRTAAGIVHFWDNEILPNSSTAVTELDELVKKHIGSEIIRSAEGVVSIDLQTKAMFEGLKISQVNLIQLCGEGAEDITEFVQCEEIFRMFPDSFALQIDGDSMSPRINDGDIVILSPSVPAVPGQVSIAHLANQIGVTCKLIRISGDSVHLIPINEKYETKVVAKKDLLWSLAVLCHIRI
ncbi:MAG: helix-turn-helix domain-containing protein [Planctomycetota bacterium]|nr:helix-turn-helix domain-containing protein [Planctomycetota bacterium]